MRFLIVRLSAIGDTILTTPLAAAVRHHFPEAEIDWLVAPPASSVLFNNPHLRRVWIVGAKGPSSHPASSPASDPEVVQGSWRALLPRLRAERYDVVLDPQGLLKSGLWSYAVGAPTRIGFTASTEPTDRLAREGASRFSPPRIAPPPEASISESYCALLNALGIQPEPFPPILLPSQTDLDNAAGLVQEEAAVHPLRSAFGEGRVRAESAAAPRLAAMVPATTFPNKYWTEREWAEVHQTLEETGLVPVYLGAPADRPLINAIAQRLGKPVINLAGRTTFMQAVAVLKLSDIALAVDTALMHAAVALNIPTIGLFGPSGWRGFERKPNFYYFNTEMGCSPCFRRPDCAAYDCMNVLQAASLPPIIQSLLEGKASLPVSAAEPSFTTSSPLLR